jgi:sugar phosphate isomerase/epimerase
MKPYPISLQLYTVRDLLKTDYDGILRQIADAGYAGVETSVPQHMKPQQYKKFLDDLGLKWSGTWAWPSKENIKELKDNAALFGSNLITNGFGPDQYKSEKLVQEGADKLNACVDVCNENGLVFCMHNHAWELDEVPGTGQLGYHMILKKCPKMMLELDCYWASNFGKIDVPALVKQYAKRAVQLHVKDGPLVKGEPNTAVGHGKLDVAACVKAADPSVTKWIIVELDHYTKGNDKMMEAVRDSFTYLTKSGLGKGK